jgi:hypothetical protein
MEGKGEVIIYQPEDQKSQLEVRLENETVWLNQTQIVNLFDRDQSVISRHIKNIFKEGELEEKSNMHFLHIANSDKPVAYYNLDVIISVGYRIKSKRGTQFRIWATQTLKDHLVDGAPVYTSIEEQAAHLLYFVIKNHPFTDGNKRIGAFLFVWFLYLNKHLLRKHNELKINDNALVALALLVAQSDPVHKELMIKLVINLINES